MRIASGDTAARGCARQILEPFPRRLRPPSFERRNTAFARRGPSPRHHASADLASVDSPSRRSANARGVTVDSICTVATRDSNHHRVPSPCAEYHRPGKAAGGARFPGSPCDMTETAERHDPGGAIQSLRGRQQRHGLAAGRLVARPSRGRSKARRRDHSAGPRPRWRMDDCVRWEGAAPHAAVTRVHHRGVTLGMAAGMAPMIESWNWCTNARTGRRRWSTPPTRSCAPG